MFLSFYSLFGAVSIIILSLYLINTLRIKQNQDKSISSFRILIGWNIIFAFLDLFWGICDSGIINKPDSFFVVSTIFHLCTVISSIIWIAYLMSVLEINQTLKIAIISVQVIVFLSQLGLVIYNIFEPVIFYISEDNKYVPCFLRPVAFYNQYVLYALAAVVAIVNILRSQKEERSKHIVALTFVGSPLIFGILQLLYPEAPYYTIGFLIGCTVIYSFVVADQEIIFLKNFIRKQKQVPRW